jgi:dipeptidyl aminopeptidase/acylaminoacyl peptidase
MSLFPSATSRWSVRARVTLGSLATAVLAACGTTGAPPPPALAAASPAVTTAPAAGASAVLAPPAQLVVQGVPPVPLDLVRAVERYTGFRGHALVGWHPTQEQLLVSWRPDGGSVNQLALLPSPLAAPQVLTDGKDPVRDARWEPREGRYLVFQRSEGGSEADQIYRLDPATRAVTPLGVPDQRHAIFGWVRSRGLLLSGSVPLDRTAETGRRAEVRTTLWLTDPMNPAGRRALAELPGGGWFDAQVAPDERSFVIMRYASANESEIWRVDLQTGERRLLLPALGETLRAVHDPGVFRPDGQLFIVSDRASEFRELMLFDPASGRLQRVSADIPWDVEGAVHLSPDGRTVYARFNVDGRDELRAFDARSLKPVALPALPPGSVGRLEVHPRSGRLAVATTSAQAPAQVHVLGRPGEAPAAWTRPDVPAGLDLSTFPEQEIVRWKSFDDRVISGLISRPPARFTGKRPVLISIHGGPEGQAKVGFLNRSTYHVNELGVALIQPNVRGSTGYGKTFLALDNGRLREDSVKDIGALLDWIAAQPDLDASRVLVSGGSYGGYMSLAVSTHYADRIAGAIDIVGISHFVTFLESTESYRRDLRRVEYGDERDPSMRAFLHSISPLTNAAKITKPLMVVQGRNDPRVPWTEAEQIVERARANGTPVWYLRAENEGHGFARKENADYQFYATIRFIEQTLLR